MIRFLTEATALVLLACLLARDLRSWVVPITIAFLGVTAGVLLGLAQ